MADWIAALARANLVGGLAILAVIAVRPAARRAFGPEVAYGLWIIPLAAVFATLLPARVVIGVEQVSGLLAPLRPDVSAPLLLGLWLTGAAGAILWLALLQARFMRLARSGKAGPAVVGLITPQLLMPPDDGAYTEAERALIRAHEREHLIRGDHKANAVLAAVQCLAWFNPLVHLAARLVRLDQELACDAAVIRKHGSAATYARALLKTQIFGEALPFGARWSGRGVHPLELRISLLGRRASRDEITGPMLVAAGAAVFALVAWTVQPPVSRMPDFEWSIAGPPCPLADSPLQAASSTRPLRVFEYEGVRFTRKFGSASCVALSEGGAFNRENYHICQFASASRIGVTAAGHTTFFAPGVGQRATVKVRGGQSSCVLGGRVAT